MTFNFSGYSLVYLAGTCLALFLACMFYSRRPARGSVQLSWFALFCAFWSVGAGMEFGVVDAVAKVRFVQFIEYPGIIGACLCWLAFAVDYTGSDAWKKPRNIILAALIPLICYIVIVTNDLHHWYWSAFHPATSRLLGDYLVFERGPFYWIFVMYNYAVYFTGAVLLVRFSLKTPRLYRAQLIGVGLGTLIPILSNLIYIFRAFDIAGLDLAPFSFTLAGVVYAFSFFRLHFLNLVPVARGTLVERLPEGIIVVDGSQTIADMNPAAEAIVGVNVAQAVGRPVAQVWPQYSEVMYRADAQGRLEMELDGRPAHLFLDVSVTPLWGENHVSVGQLVMIRDVTARRRMEQSLKESESRYSTLVEQSNEGVLIVQNGRFIFSNHTISDLTGYNRAELLNQPVDFLIPGFEQPSEGSSVTQRVFEVQLRRRDGVSRTAEISEGPIQYAGASAMIMSVRDVTERKLVKQRLEALYSQESLLRASLQTEIDKRSKYTRSLVHELKTPLKAISASIQELESRLDQDIYLALVKNIGRAALNLDQRINELIELANGEVGMLKIDPVELDMALLLREIVSELTPVAAAKGLDTLTEIPDLPAVLGDRSRLRQVMTNLLSNAIKFTNRGSILVRASALSENEVLVEVIDSGRGMEADEVENIFDPYRRKMDVNHDMRGLGIGLALSKMFVELHHGRIAASSTPGKGSNFNFTVPVFRKKPPAD